MKKSTRAAVAGVAGLGLLAGGATFAIWNAEEAVPGATIDSGTLTLSSVAGGQWSDHTDPEDVQLIGDIENYLVVPGDQLRYTESFTIGATGENLSASLTTDGVTKTESGEEGTLAESVTVNSIFERNGEPITEVTSGQDGDTVSVEVIVDIAGDLGNSGQDGTVELSDGSVVLQQN